MFTLGNTTAAFLITVSDLWQVVESDEEEELTQAIREEGNEGDQFEVIQLYSEKATVSNLGSSGTGGAASLSISHPEAVLLLVLLLTATLSWG